MSVPEELLERIEYLFESEADDGIYTFVVRRSDSATRPEFSIRDVRNPNDDLVPSYPASVQDDIDASLTYVRALFVSSFSVTPLVLSYEAVYEGPDPNPQTVTVGNDGTFGSLLYFSATPSDTWLSVSPELYGGIRCTSEVEVSVSPLTASLPVGLNSATVVLADSEADDSPVTVSVDVTILPKAEINLSPSSLSFSAPQGGPDPADQTFDAENVGPVSSKLNYTVDVAEASASWLSVSPSSGGPLNGGDPADTVTVSAGVTGLSVGTYTGTIRVTDPTAENSPQSVSVELTIT